MTRPAAHDDSRPTHGVARARGWIRREGIKHVAHLVNRVAAALRAAGHDARVEDMRQRILDPNNKWSLRQAIEIAADYVDIREGEE